MVGKLVILCSFVYVLIFGTWTKTILVWPAILLALIGWLAIIWRADRRWLPSYSVIIAAFAVGYFGLRQLSSSVDLFGRADLILLLIGIVGYQTGTFVRSTRWFRVALAISLICAVSLNLGIGAFQYFVNASWSPYGLVEVMGLQLERTVDSPSAGGMFNSENHFASFLIAPGVLCSALFLRLGKGWLKLLSLLGFLSIAGGIAISTSRAVMLAFMVAVAVQIVLYLCIVRVSTHRKHYGIALAAGLAIFVAACGFWSVLNKEYKFESNQSFGIVGALATRASMWERGVQQWMQSPFVGSGARSYSYIERSFRQCDDERWPTYRYEDLDAVYTHNEFIQTAAEYGSLGLLLVLGLIGGHFYFAWDRMNRGVKFGYDLFAICAVVGLSVSAMFDFCFHLPSVLLSFTCVLGLMGDRQRVSKAPWFKWHWKIVLIALILVSTFPIYRWAKSDLLLETGVYHEYAERPLEAVGYYRKGIEVDPENFEFYARAGKIYLSYAVRNEMFPQASKSWLLKAEELLDLGWRYHESEFSMGLDVAEVASRLGKVEKAEQWFEHLFRTAPCHRHLYLSYGKHLLRHNEIARARALYLEMLEDVPLNWRQKLEIENFLKQLPKENQD